MQKKKSLFGAILLAAVLLLLVGVEACFPKGVLPCMLYYEGRALYGGLEIPNGRSETVEVDGQEVIIEWQDTSELKQIGEIAESLSETESPKKEFSNNIGVPVGTPVYQVIIRGEEWLMVEYERELKYSTGIMTQQFQHFFREGGEE